MTWMTWMTWLVTTTTNVVNIDSVLTLDAAATMDETRVWLKFKDNAPWIVEYWTEEQIAITMSNADAYGFKHWIFFLATDSEMSDHEQLRDG